MNPHATCPTCDHPAADHQSGDGPWTGYCGRGLGTDDACECEGPGHEHLDFVTWGAPMTDTFRRPRYRWTADGMTLDPAGPYVLNHMVPPLSGGAAVPVCAFCGLVLERAGDAIVVPA